MVQVSVIIPNFNGMAYLDGVLQSLEKQTFTDFDIILVDNGSQDASRVYVKDHYPRVHILPLPDNYGFSRAVNEGIRASEAPYVILLNNDTEVKEDFVEILLNSIRRHPEAFACQAKMLQYSQREILDGAGDSYCALGWAFARGKGKSHTAYNKEEKIFSCCAGAAIYRKSLFETIGYFDDEHFAYLEDLDIGYRARIFGYENWYIPEAEVYHVGSGTTGSRYNQFKIRYSSRNNIYMISKNMPFLQLIINLPFLAAGFAVKFIYFAAKGFGREYLAGIKNGFQLIRHGRHIDFEFKNLKNYIGIQADLWINPIRRFTG